MPIKFFKIQIVFFLILFNFVNDLFAQSNVPLLPLPKSVSYKKSNVQFKFNSATSLFFGTDIISNKEQVKELFSEMNIKLIEQKNSSRSNSVVFEIDNTLDSLTNEGYVIDVSNKHIKIKSASQNGLYYGAVTLCQLITKTGDKKNTCKVPGIYIEDKPRFAWRGFMLDVSRQFFSIDVLRQYVDWLAMHKINVFHIHLTDDQGWRMEIKKYPDLTRKGAWRGKGEVLKPAFGSNDERYGGFYTQKQLKDLVSYAAARNVNILPEIDIPGHSRAVIATFPHLKCKIDSAKKVNESNVYCLENKEIFPFVMDVLAEVAEVFPFEYIHIGGDEVNSTFWKNCELCSATLKTKFEDNTHSFQNAFISKIEKGLAGLGKKMIGWNEVLNCGNHLPATALMAWEDESKCYVIPKCGQNVILTPQTHYYLDKRQGETERGWFGEIITTKDVYMFSPGLENHLNSDEQKQILGVQGNLWSERLANPCNFDHYQAFPRLCAIAETGWTEQPKRNWDSFVDRMCKYHFQRLESKGIKYRLFTPEYTINGELLTVLPVGPGIVVRYTMDGTVPTISSQLYTTPISIRNAGIVNFRAFTPSGYASPVIMIRL